MIIERSEPASFVAEASRLSGEVAFHAEAHVHGVVEGNIVQQSHEKLQIGPSGWVRGNIFAPNSEVIVAGRVEGDIRALKITLAPTANVSGVLSGTKVRVLPGAIVHAEFQMKRPMPKSRQQKAA